MAGSLHPKPAAKDATVEQSRVRTIDFGTDFLRDGDGRPVHQFGVHRYKLKKDPKILLEKLKLRLPAQAKFERFSLENHS